MVLQAIVLVSLNFFSYGLMFFLEDCKEKKGVD